MDTHSVRHTLRDQSDAANNAQWAEQELVWFAFWVFLVLAVFKIVAGAFGRSLIILSDGFYSAACLAHVGALLLAHQESMRPADHRYPYGYGNRAAMFLFIVFCLLVTANTYLFFRTLPVRGTSFSFLGKITLGTFLSSATSLLMSILVFHKFVLTSEQFDSKDIEGLRALLKKAIIVSTITMAAVICGLLGWSRPEKWGIIAIFIITLWVCAENGYKILLALTDKGLSEHSLENITRLVQRAAGGGRVVSVKTKNVGKEICIDVWAAFPPGATIAQANAIEDDIEAVLSRKVPGIGHVTVYWDG